MNGHPNLPAGGVYRDAYALAADLRAVPLRAQRKSAAVTRHYAMLMETRVKARASGRPGPRVITGAYRRSWTSGVDVTVTGVRGWAGTNAPQARRLEFGFVGADRLGRVYAQPPFPHAGPAFDETAPQWEDAMADILRTVL